MIRQIVDALILLAGVVAFLVHTVAVPVLWLRILTRIVSLMRQHGIAVTGLITQSLLALLEAIFVSALAFIIGRIGWRRWKPLALIFASGFLMLPCTIFAPRCASRSNPIRFSDWLVLVVVPVPFALLGAWVGSRPRRRREQERLRQGLCIRCAYDLTGNVSGVCPECGTKTPHDAEHQIN